MTSRTRTLTAPPSQDRPVDGQVRGVALSRERHPLPAKTTLAADDQVTLDVDPKPFMLKGFAVIILAFGGFGGWAAMAPLDSATVASGDIIMEVVPTNEQLVIDARVTIQDIDSVKIGQEAGVLLTGFNQATTPTLVGEVDHVAADRQIDQATNEPYFQAKITVSEEQIARLDQNQVLRPGMPADAIIVTGERTVLQYLTKPITQILARSWREE